MPLDEKIRERSAEIEKILDGWGFRPEGMSYGKREQKRAAIEMWLRRFLPSEFDDAFLILKKIQYHDNHRVDAYIEQLGVPENLFPYTPLNETDLSGVTALVFFDDIIGSGHQAVTFAQKQLQNIKIDKYYVALLAFEEGYKN